MMTKNAMTYFRSILYFLVLILAACGQKPVESDVDPVRSWEEIEQAGSGKTLTMMMWQGDPLINRFMQERVVPELKTRHGIDLEIVGGQGNVIVSALMAELEAGRESSEIDLVWINGETFFQLREIAALYGPFVDVLPNSKYIDWENPFIRYDFQQEVDGYECPWGNVQLSLIYHSDKVLSPPQNLEELEEWVKLHPGKFTIPNEFTGMTLLKSWLIELAGGAEALNGDFDEEKYLKFSDELWSYINRIRPYFWNGGESFPSSLAQTHQLFANGELWFTMSNNDAELDNKILQGVFPESSRSYVPEIGTIQNSHYLGIVKHSSQKEAAMLVCNFLISPEMQFEKMQPAVWGDHTILSMPRLPEDWRLQFESIPGRKYAPSRQDIQDRALMEPAPEYMIRLFEDFRKRVLNV